MDYSNMRTVAFENFEKFWQKWKSGDKLGASLDILHESLNKTARDFSSPDKDIERDVASSVERPELTEDRHIDAVDNDEKRGGAAASDADLSSDTSELAFLFQDPARRVERPEL